MMEIAWAVVLIGIAFYWLMVETKWLTIRLEAYSEIPIPEFEGFNSIITSMPTIIYLGAMVGGLSRLCRAKFKNSERVHEEFMTELWKIYGRKQPAKIKVK